MRCNWCSCDGELKRGPDGFFFFGGGGRGACSQCSREASSTCRLISESSQRPPFIHHAGWLLPSHMPDWMPNPLHPHPHDIWDALHWAVIQVHLRESQCAFFFFPPSVSTPQTRRWSCGRSARGTSVRRATTWRMRTDGSGTPPPSLPYG